jgi:hypothetical protein
MVDRKRSFDIFISYAGQDSALADQLATACRAAGLSSFSTNDIPAGDNADEILWEALAESKAFLAIISRATPTAYMGIELGAALAWNKPIFGIVEEASSRPPAGFPAMRLYPASRIDDVIHAVKAADADLTNDDREQLKLVYQELAVPLDKFATELDTLRQLTDQFRRKTNKDVSQERLLAELLRMRKAGKLPAKKTGKSS